MGCLTTAMGVVLAIFLPDSPLTARFLTAEEKKIAIERIRGNQQSVGNHDFKMYQVKEAFMDPMVSSPLTEEIVIRRITPVFLCRPQDVVIFFIRDCAQHP
ncbi:hypothetical protein QFC19_004582 [Naganishia cerealis]|uniref:Uncharacterized protein n=1 Tax=Naganishia cerealis TaxID=610337 RepID=A0ACC2VV30_9TREE|nr:hypothetical protein QFC19_004582 [Naganishia cerealis]